MLIEELKDTRRSAGWSQKTLAERTGVDVQTIKRLKEGIGSVPTLIAAMAALDFRLTGLAPGATLADQLRNQRRKRAMSLDEAAVRAAIARATVASLEGGGGTIASLLALMAVVAPKARRRSPERSYRGQGDKDDRNSRFTPAVIMDHIYAAFGEVDLDPCGHVLSPVVARRRILLSKGGDGLADEWSGRLAFVNAPFSELMKWLRRAHSQWQAAKVDTVVC
jgi:transcriptional regulator with XRE-family HTH domain